VADVGGMKIKISMDTKEFKESIKNLNREINTVQQEFRTATEKLGKFGDVTDKLKLQEESLTKQLEIQSRKVTELKSAYETSVAEKGKDATATQNMYNQLLKAEQYEARLKNELVRTTEEIAKQEKATGGLSKTMIELKNNLSEASKKIIELGKDMTTKLTVPIMALGGLAVNSFANFEEGINKVSTIADTSAKSIKDIKKEILSLSNELGASTGQLNEALYQTISATGDTKNAMDYVGIATKSAKGGFTDVETAVDGLTTVMNAYKLQGKNALQEVSDQMLMAQNYGKTTFGEMANSMGNVIPIASSLNISTKDLFASIAVLTKNGIATSESITGLKASYSSIIKPSKEAGELAAKLGLEFNSSHLKSVGWAKFLEEVREKTKGNTDQMATLFGSVEALNTVTVLATTGAEDFANALKSMEVSAGATDQAFNKMN